MRFGPVPIDESLGGILAHGIRFKDVVLKKGVVISDNAIVALKSIGFETITVARLDEDDLGEDAAALALAEAVAGCHLLIEAPSTGRVNIYATCDGLFTPVTNMVHRVNEIDEGITLATLPAFGPVSAGDMVATVKIIPFAVPKGVVARAAAVAKADRLSVTAFLPLRIGVISTVLPGLKPSVISKTLKVLEERIALTPAKIITEMRVFHETSALVAAIEKIEDTCDMLVIFGASAIADRQDVIPAAIAQSRGEIIHFGMPADPGNLLLLGLLSNGKPVIGAPGCARSPKPSGFDWILHRLMIGRTISSAEIRCMGLGGLLIDRAEAPKRLIKKVAAAF